MLYLMVRDAGGFIRFLKAVFGAVEVTRAEAPDGTILMAELTIGGEPVLRSEAGGPYEPQAITIELGVEDVEGTYRNAVAAGAEAVWAVDGEAMVVRDPAGNAWRLRAATAM